ncbi:MAG: SDR family NAD(P)-dependent oxidoreductase [Janthinobacterium lividum]
MSDKKVALVTGAAGAIGSSTAAKLCQDGFKVLLLDRAELVHQVGQQLADAGYATESHVLELVELDAVAKFAQDTVARLGKVDVLVNNAGLHIYKGRGVFGIEELSTDQWRQIFDINLAAPFVLCRELLPAMRTSGWGRIVNISSRVGRSFTPGTSADYVSSKAGMIGFTRVLAGEFGRFGITANIVAPGRISTPQANRVSEDVIADALRSIPVGRLGVPDDIASAVAYLVSDAASFMNGAVLDVNGGGFMP